MAISLGPKPWPFFLIARKPAGSERPGNPPFATLKVFMLTYHYFPLLMGIWPYS